MLTNSQSWRRLKSSRAKQRRNHDLEYQNACNSSGSTLCKEQTEVACPSRTVTPSHCQPTAASTTDSPNGKKVRFSSVIRVCLVPCRSDFLSDFHDLFWMREDYQSFKEDAVRELRAHWLANRTTVKEAIIDLYQPNAADHAASKTFLTHVDSMAQLRLAAFQINSSEDLTTLQTSPFVELGSAAGAQLLTAANSSAAKTYLCDSSESSDNASNDVETWKSTSPPTPLDSRSSQSINTTAPLEPPPSDKSLLNQVTASHINAVTPMRRGSLRREENNESTASQECKASSSIFSQDRSDALDRAENTLASATGPTTIPVPETTSFIQIPATQIISKTAATRSDTKPSSEGLRIILREESPASSISSFETPMLIYGQ